MLGDGVAYAKKILNADIVVDMATLTGAQVRTGPCLLTNLLQRTFSKNFCVFGNVYNFL